MSKKKTYEIDSLLDKDLCSIMGDRVTDETITPRKKDRPSAEHEKQISERRRYQIARTTRWICFLGVMASFLHWATGKGLVDPILSMPGICLCTAIGGYQLGCCLANLQQLPEMRRAHADVI